MRLLFLIILAATSVVGHATWSVRKDCSDVFKVAALHYEIKGNPHDPTIVLIPGLGGRLETFNSVVDHLVERHFQVLVIDQRGHGKSPSFGEDFSPEIMAKDLKYLLDDLGIKKIVPIGHSLGGKTAMAFAGLYPDSTGGLIVEDMEPQARMLKDPQSLLVAARRADFLPKQFISVAEATEYLNPFFKDAETFAQRSSVTSDGSGIELWVRPKAFFFYRLQGNTAEMRPTLKQYHGPILFLRAEFSGSISENGRAIIENELPGANLLEIPGAQHNIHASRPEAFVEAVNGFLSESK